MPTTPQVNFEFVNENVKVSEPLLGVSHVVACTSQGPENDPSILIRNIPQFRRIYGKEVLPGFLTNLGSKTVNFISNIEKALELGSTLRISRITPYTMYRYYLNRGTPKDLGTLGKLPEGSSTAGTGGQIVLYMRASKNTSPDAGFYIVYLRFTSVGKTLPYPVDNLVLNVKLNISETENCSLQVDFYEATTGDNPTLGKKLGSEEIPLFNGPATGSSVTDYKIGLNREAFLNLIRGKNDSKLQLELTTLYVPQEGNTGLAEAYHGSREELIEYMETQVPEESFNELFSVVVLNQASITKVPKDLFLGLIGADTITNGSLDYTISLAPSNNNAQYGIITKEQIVNAFEALRPYKEGYQLMLSSMYPNSTQEVASAYQEILKKVVSDNDTVLYVEIPSMEDLDKLTPEFYHKNVALFYGGVKYYDDNKNLLVADTIGSAVGLGDASASKYGPWYSFAGMNRGILRNAVGPGHGNLVQEELSALAEASVNTVVVKDTRNMGKQTMLWHNFSASKVNDSERFLGIVRLNLYLKKNLSPILESYLEEPNIWDTWKKIYFEVKEILDDLVTKRAMSEYTWYGDQFVTSYQDLSINTEEDVRQGKYRAKLVYKDIVALQDITMDIIIDSASGNVSVSSN